MITYEHLVALSLKHTRSCRYIYMNVSLDINYESSVNMIVFVYAKIKYKVTVCVFTKPQKADTIETVTHLQTS